MKINQKLKTQNILAVAAFRIFWGWKNCFLLYFFYLGSIHGCYALSPLLLVVIITLRVCFLGYDFLLLARNTPGNARFSQVLDSSIIYHSYGLWPQKIMRNLYTKKCFSYA